MIVDPEAVKNICNASVDSKGFCFYKATNRIKRHKAMDSLGFPFFAHCTKGSVSELSRVDNEYYPEKIIEELKKIYPAYIDQDSVSTKLEK